MNEPKGVHGDLDPFQAEVARIALAATETWSFALAGGNALVAHGMLSRPTQDVDLFTTTPGGPGQAAEIVTAALRATGLNVTSEVAPDGEFARLHVSDAGRAVVVDLARDWRAHPPVRMSVGLVLHRDDAVSSKVGAMVGRGLPRDFIDVAAALPHYDRATLLRLLFERDPGLRPEDVALAYVSSTCSRTGTSPHTDWIRPRLTISGSASAPGLAMPPRTTKPQAPTTGLTRRRQTECRTPARRTRLHDRLRPGRS